MCDLVSLVTCNLGPLAWALMVTDFLRDRRRRVALKDFRIRSSAAPAGGKRGKCSHPPRVEVRSGAVAERRRQIVGVKRRFRRSGLRRPKILSQGRPLGFLVVPKRTTIEGTEACARFQRGPPLPIANGGRGIRRSGHLRRVLGEVSQSIHSFALRCVAHDGAGG